MTASQSVLELVTAAQVIAETQLARISKINQQFEGQEPPDAQNAVCREATVAIETAAVDIFSLFEARMQHHFKRGPFSRKLASLLAEAGEADLADRVRHYYLAINVLKHGKGASYRELLEDPRPFIVLKPSDDDAVAGLVDVTAPGFFDGLTTTIVEAYHFLEAR